MQLWSGDQVLAEGLTWIRRSRPVPLTPVDGKRAAHAPDCPEGSRARTASLEDPALNGCPATSWGTMVSAPLATGVQGDRDRDPRTPRVNSG